MVACAILAALPLSHPSRAGDLPVLFDARERLPRPDLSSVLRVRFLTTTDFPPFNFADQTGRLAGFHIDLARAICAELGIEAKCQIQALPYGELEAALAAAQGEAVLAGMAVSDDLRARFSFTPALSAAARRVLPATRRLSLAVRMPTRCSAVVWVSSAGTAHDGHAEGVLSRHPGGRLSGSGKDAGGTEGKEDRRRVRRFAAALLLDGWRCRGQLRAPCSARPMSRSAFWGRG